MAAKINWHRYRTELRQCHRMYTQAGPGAESDIYDRCVRFSVERLEKILCVLRGLVVPSVL